MLSILKKSSVLYVEDEPEIQAQISEYLKSHFAHVFLAANATEALKIYHQQNPDVLFLDINLPDMDGLMLARKIRQKNDGIKIIMLTAHTEEDKLLQAIELNLTKYLVKPVAPQVFKETLRILARDLKKESRSQSPASDIPAWINVAKLQMPHLTNIYPRKTLFKCLDSMRSLAWISAAAGSGKTSLVSSYLSARKKHCIWYRLDADDNDPATFFHYLALAAKKEAPRSKDLPLLTAEYQMGITTFSRRFFERLFTQIKTPCTLVFDNYECLTNDSILHTILCEAVNALPEKASVLITSRYAPPPPFSRLKASQNYGRIDNDMLQLSFKETSEIAKIHSKHALTKDQLQTIHTLSQGWMAGIVLLANTKNLPAEPRQTDASLQNLFDYFTEEVSHNIASKNRHILQKIAILPIISISSAIELTGHLNAGDILAALAEDNFFTYEQEEQSTYHLHPLFRVSLLKQAEKELTTDEFINIKAKAASLLESDQQIEAAYDLYIEIGELSEAARLICQQAPALLQQGRFKTLLGWISRLPDTMLTQTPWVLYWQGIGQLFPDPMGSRLTLEKAYMLFEKQQETPGAILSCCGAIMTYPMVWDDFHQMDPWLEKLESLLDPSPNNIPPEITAQITNAMVSGYLYRRTGHAQLPLWVERSIAILPKTQDPFIRVMLLQNCFFMHIWQGEFTKASLLLEQFRPILTGKKSGAFSQIWFHAIECCYYWNCAEADLAIAEAEKALQLSSSTGVHVMDVLAHYHLGIANAIHGRLEAARENLKNLRPLIMGQLMNEAACYQLEANIAWHEGNLNKAREAIELSVRLADQAGLSFPHALQLTGLAIIQFEQGDEKEASNTLAKAEAIAKSNKLNYILFETGLFKAYFKLQQGQYDKAINALEIALNIGRKTDRVATSWWQAKIMSMLCGAALQANIHPDYVRKIIRKRKLLPTTENYTLEQWPWPVRIYTLGGLHIEIDGQALTPGNKSPSKPLELLEILISLGAKNIKTTKLADILWPEAEGDDALESFKTNLRRLRKLLQHDEVLPLKEGRLSLNQDICWTDAQALLELSSTTENPDNIIRLYTGSFLGDQDTPWAMHLREQLRNSFLKAIQSQGKSQQSEGNWQQAIDFYEKGLAVERFTEVFYQQLMICYQQCNQPAEALHVYDRCKTILEQEFGISPSRKIQELANTIKAMHK